MAEPKKRLTNTRSGQRRSQIKLKKLSLSKCPKCHTEIMPHRVCYVCGTYKGLQIINMEKKDKKSKSTPKESESHE